MLPVGAGVCSTQGGRAELGSGEPCQQGVGAVGAVWVPWSPGTLTAHGEDHRQQLWLLEALMIHSAGDFDAVRLAQGHHSVAAGDCDGALLGPWLLGVSGLPLQG